MIAIGAVTGLIYLFCHFVSFKLCSNWLFWHCLDHISVYIYVYIYIYIYIYAIYEQIKTK